MFFDYFFDRSGKRADLSFLASSPEEEKFANYYTQTIQPDLETIEDERLAKHSQIMRRLDIANLVFASVLGVLIALYIKYLNSNQNGINDVLIENITFLTIALIFFIYYWISWPLKSTQLQLKNILLNHSFNFWGNFSLISDRKFDTNKIADLRMFANFDKSRCDKHLIGTYKGISLEIVEIHLTTETGTGEDRNTVNVFDGIFIFIYFKNRLSSKTVIINEKSKLEYYINNVFLGDKLQRIELEDPIFEKKLDVFSSSQIESRYILTPTFMELFLDLSRYFRNANGKTAMACFVPDCIALAIPHDGDLFPLPKLRKPDYKTSFQNLFHDLNATFKVIDSIISNPNLHFNPAVHLPQEATLPPVQNHPPRISPS